MRHAIAHRGHWFPDIETQNRLTAITAAGAAGYGMELDIRVSESKHLRLQHDLLDDQVWLLDLVHEDWFPTLIAALRAAPVILWDVKEIAAIEPLVAWLAEYNLLGNAILFDQELAGKAIHWGAAMDACALANHPVSYLRRVSEHAHESLYDALDDPDAYGVWLDAWDRDWVTANIIATVQAAGKRAYVCSPELHQRAIALALWRDWAGADGIVTDFPHLLESLSTPPLQPAGWHKERA